MQHHANLNPDDQRKLTYLFGQERARTIYVDSGGVWRYSVTPRNLAARITGIVVDSVASLRRGIRIFECCGCIGGDTLSFLGHPRVDHVFTVETDPERYACLQRNTSSFSQQQQVTTHHGDFMQALPTSNADVVYWDPPWDGLDQVDVLTAVRRMLERSPVAVLKVPPTFDLARLADLHHVHYDLAHKPGDRVLMRVVQVHRVRALVLIPYRARAPQEFREQHKNELVPFLSGTWGLPCLVLEQDDDDAFQRGPLLNAGFQLAAECHPLYLLLHDVDLMPADTREMRDLYMRTPGPNEIVHHASLWDDRYHGSSYMGGVLSIRPALFRRMGGFPCMRGWGGEDDELRRRALALRVHISRFEKSSAMCYRDLEEPVLGGTTWQQKNRFLKTHGLKNMRKREQLAEFEDQRRRRTQFQDCDQLQFSHVPVANGHVKIKLTGGYDTIVAAFKSADEERPFLRHLRQRHNFLKHLLLREACRNKPHVRRIVDLAGGKFGDLHKYLDLRPERIVLVDSSKSCVEEATRRFNEVAARRRTMVPEVTILQGDMADDTLLANEQPFQLAVINFALHYVAPRFENLFANLQRLVVPGGRVLLGGFPDERTMDQVHALVRSPFNERDIRIRGWEHADTTGYTFQMGSSTPGDMREYRVRLQSLRDVAARHGFAVVFLENLETWCSDLIWNHAHPLHVQAAELARKRRLTVEHFMDMSGTRLYAACILERRSAAAAAHK